MKKKRFFVLVFLLASLGICETPAKSYDATQLPLVVRNMPEWSNEYPTVINNWDGMTLTSLEGELPPLLSVVTSINGTDTKNMSEDNFNDLLMSQGKCSVEYLIKRNGTNIKKGCTLSYYTSVYWAEGINMNSPDAFPEDITIKNIKNASFFSLNTFSYKVGGLDEIDEVGVMEAAGKTLSKFGFKKVDDVESADMLLELSKSRDEYNGYQIILNVIDGNAIRNGIRRNLWTLQVSGLNDNFKSQQSVIKIALNKQCNNFPFDVPTYRQSIHTLGMIFKSEDAIPSGKTLMILKGSDAYDKGLRSGDAIIGAYAGYSWSTLLTKTRRYYFKPNKSDNSTNWGVDLFIILPVIPQFTYNNAYHYLVDNTWRGGDNSKNHFKIKNTYGRKYSVSAPFEERRFNFKYIK